MWRRGRGLLAAAIAAMVAALGGLPATATPPSTPPASRLAPIQPPEEGAERIPALDLAAISVEGELGDGSVEVTVQLRSPLLALSEGYRVAVVIGDPAGSLERGSMFVDDGVVTGSLERLAGGGWEPIGSTVVEVDPGEGRVVIVMPLTEVAADAAIRAEASLDVDGTVTEVVSPWFGALALLGAPDEGRLEGGYWGTVEDAGGEIVDALRLPAPSPWLSVVNRALVVGTTEPPPAELLDRPVVDAKVFVRVGNAFEDFAGPREFLLLDRFTGAVQLLRAAPEGLEDLTGDAEWVGVGLPDDDPTAPTSSSFDLELVGEALGRPIDPPATVVSADQTFTLDDGRVVTAYGVAATLAWFDAAVEATATTTAAPATDVVVDVPPAQATDGDLLPFVVGGAIVVLLLALVGLATWRRGRRRRDRRSEPRPALTPPVPAAPAGDERPPSRTVRVVRPAERVEPAGPAQAAQAAPAAQPVDAREPAGGAEALAALDDEFRRIEERIQQLERRAEERDRS